MGDVKEPALDTSGPAPCWVRYLARERERVMTMPDFKDRRRG